MRISRQMLGLAAVGVFGMTAQLQAQYPQIDFHGGVIGCFTTTPGFGCPLAATAQDNGVGTSGSFLLYKSDGITGTTNPVSGKVGFSDGLSGSYGHLSLNAGGGYINTPGIFLELDFLFNPSTPGGFVAPGTPTVVPDPIGRASIVGTIGTDLSGDVFVNFGPDVHFFFTAGGHLASCINPTPVCGPGALSGSALLHVNDIDLNGKSSNIPITGSIQLDAAPEPATVALFATGLLGLIPVARRRASSKRA